jgi:RNA polymerase sigma-70 factor (ECF subfamily)
MSTDHNPPRPPHAAGDPVCGAAEQETDAVLIGRVQCGDERALGSLYDRWADRVYSIALHLLGDPDEAEEVVERTFSKVWQDARQFDATRGNVEAWIVVISRSHALSRRRAELRRKRHDELRTSYLENEGSVSYSSPLHSAAEGQHRELVDDAMKRLPDEQQRVVRMAFFEGLSQSEIAARLGIPLGTVKTRVRLAFAKLRDSLAGLRERDR